MTSSAAEPGRTFGRVADAYARTRPPYARAVVERAAAELGVDEHAAVLDLAAGTGNLTRTLRGCFATVLAVEPDPRMRALAGGDVLDGTAESIPLPDGAVDAVFVGEAFHWFDHERALAEIRRVGRGLAVLMRSWGEQEQPGLLPAPLRDDLDAVWARFHGHGRTFPDWREVLEADGDLELVDTVRISGRDLVDLHLTGSTPASIPAEERDAIAGRAYPLMNETYEMRVLTHLYWKRFA